MALGYIDTIYPLPADQPWTIIEVSADETGAPLHHYASVYDGVGNLTQYIDKVSQGTVAHTPPATYTFGPNIYATSTPLTIATAVTFDDTAFTQTEIDSDYNLYFASGSPASQISLISVVSSQFSLELERSNTSYLQTTLSASMSTSLAYESSSSIAAQTVVSSDFILEKERSSLSTIQTSVVSSFTLTHSLVMGANILIQTGLISNGFKAQDVRATVSIKSSLASTSSVAHTFSLYSNISIGSSIYSSILLNHTHIRNILIEAQSNLTSSLKISQTHERASALNFQSNLQAYSIIRRDFIGEILYLNSRVYSEIFLNVRI